MRILITAFEPFGGEMTNASLETLNVLAEEDGAEIIKCSVPVAFRECTACVMDAFEKYRPDALILLGQAGGRECVTPERFAYNMDDARVPDNKMEQPVQRRIHEDGPDRREVSLPVDLIAERIRKCGVPCSVSEDPGRFVCNHLLYTVLSELDRRNAVIPAGFIHLPYLSNQDVSGYPVIQLEEAVKAVSTAVRVLIEVWRKNENTDLLSEMHNMPESGQMA